jgi:hypothetical protein
MNSPYTHINNRISELNSSKNSMYRQLSLIIMMTLVSICMLTVSTKAQINIPKKVNVGIVYPISSNGRFAWADTTNLSVNLIAGVSSAADGPSVAGFSNIIYHDANGPQIAGFSNHIGGTANGALFAGFLNTYSGGRSSSFAGFSNAAHGNVTGAQFAGFSNYARDLNGAQFAGFLNKADNMNGSQFAGFMNVATRNISASQMAGFMNTADDVNGSQIAGFMNTAKNVNGSQIGGFINVAKKVKGAQIAGFMNVADSSDYPIGFINMIKNGEKSVSISTDEDLTTMASFKSGGKVLYGIIAAGYNFKNDKEVYAAEMGLGGHIILSKVFNINAEISQSVLEGLKSGEYLRSSFRLMPAFKLSPHLEIFGGPSFNYINTNTAEGKTLHDHYQRTWMSDSGRNFQALYISYTGGIAIPF